MATKTKTKTKDEQLSEALGGCVPGPAISKMKRALAALLKDCAKHGVDLRVDEDGWSLVHRDGPRAHILAAGEK